MQKFNQWLRDATVPVQRGNVQKVHGGSIVRVQEARAVERPTAVLEWPDEIAGRCSPSDRQLPVLDEVLKQRIATSFQGLHVALRDLKGLQVHSRYESSGIGWGLNEVQFFSFLLCCLNSGV